MTPARRRSLAGCTTSPPAGSRSGRPPGSAAARPTTTPSTRCSGDTAHRVSGLPGTDEAVPLGWALTALRGLGERRFRLVLPVPGDVRGLPAVPGWPRWRSSRGRPPSASGWRWCPRRWARRSIAVDGVPAGRRPAGARRPSRARCARVSGALDLAVGDAARTLAGLDVARWNPEVPALLAGLGEDGAGTGAARRPRPAGGLRAGPGPAAGRRPRPGDGRRPGGRGQPRAGRPRATRPCGRWPTPSARRSPPRTTGCPAG